jgi:glycolate oxidase subunit GlcD
VIGELRRLVGDAAVLDPAPAHFLGDETEGRGVHGRADAVVLPGDAEQVAAVVRWCYAHDVPIVPRGGGTGYAAGAVPLDGGVVLALDRLDRVRSFEPLLWRMEVEAGVPTAEVRRRARESGLLLPPDPGAAEQSQIGGNVATNAGGPHAFKYGVTGAWVTGVEAVVAPGELVRVGGPVRKDVAGYDLRGLLVGSEGTLGVITAVWLRLIPAPEAAWPVAAFYPDTAAGCAAIERVLGNGLPVAALEFLDAATVRLAGAGFPGRLADGFLVVAEADGTAEGAAVLRDEVAGVLADGALSTWTPSAPSETVEFWRWRDGVSLRVQAHRGGKSSEDIAVPVERLAEAVEETHAIGRRHRLVACAWGHAGDGNLHSTFLVDPRDADEVARARAASEELFALGARLGGTISGEHGVGAVKAGRLGLQWPAAALDLHEAVKQAFDPKNLFNPGKKRAR